MSITKWVTVLILASCVLWSKSSQLDPVYTLVDSSLHQMDMHRRDIWLPWDVVNDDPHRLPVIKHMFDDPMSILDTTANWGERLYQDDRSWLRATLWELDLNQDSTVLDPTPRFISPSEDQFKRSIRKKLPDPVRLITNAVAQTHSTISNYINTLDSATFNILYNNCDSMLLMSEDSQDLSIWQLKENEIEGQEQSRNFYDSAAKVDLIPLILPGLELDLYLHQVLDSLQIRTKIKTQSFKTEMGEIYIGGPENNTYTKDYAVIIDFGGNDTYLFSEVTKEKAFAHHARVIIDMDGDDQYLTQDFALGAGTWGVNLLYDQAGNDRYFGDNFSLGSGLFGLGILRDMAGNDTYTGGLCSQGSGAFGIGYLVDTDGTDTYQCHAQSQGFGFTRGAGILQDFHGNDVYITASPFQDFLRYESHFIAFSQGAGLGHRPIASGGLGFLADHHGNDLYQSDIYGQATAYWYSYGGIYDRSGSDRYVAFQYAQGAGVHMAHGLLLDIDGNDHYYSHGVSQGCGHDIALGALADLAGDDDYSAESLSMGGGNADAISILADISGDDTYMARQLPNMMGYSDFRRDYGMIGIFVDGGGSDQYGSYEQNEEISQKSTFGVFADFELYTPAGISGDEPLLTPADSLKIPLASTADSLFIQASAAPQKFQYNVQPARDSLITMGADALPFLSSKLATESARERHALSAILKAMVDGPDSVAVQRLVVDSLQASTRRSIGMCALVAGDKQITSALPALFKLLQNPDWRVRAMATLYIGKIGDNSSIPKLIPLISDDHVHVRMRAAYAVGRIQPDTIRSFLPLIVYDPFQLVRNSFFQGLKRSKKPIPIAFIIESAPSARGSVKRQIVQLLPWVTEDEQAVIAYREFLKYQPPEIALWGQEAVASSKNDFWKNALEDENPDSE